MLSCTLNLSLDNTFLRSLLLFFVQFIYCFCFSLVTCLLKSKERCNSIRCITTLLACPLFLELLQYVKNRKFEICFNLRINKTDRICSYRSKSTLDGVKSLTFSYFNFFSPSSINKKYRKQ